MWKNLKSLFIIEETAPARGNEEAPETATPAAPAQATPAGPARAEAGQVTEKFTDILFQAMEAANIQGFDYLEFKKSLQSLSRVTMDEPTRYQSAFAMAQTMGATPESLIQTAQHYADILKQEQEKFETAVAKQKQLQIGSKQTEIQQLEAASKAKEEQIRQLTEEIGNNRRQMESLQQEVEAAAAKVETTRHNFLASYQHLVSQIREDMEKMKQFLK